MIKFVSEDMQDGEVAALYEEGEDTIVLVNQQVTDPVARCEAVNKLMDRALALVSFGLLLLLLHLSEQGTSTASQYVQSLGI